MTEEQEAAKLLGKKGGDKIKQTRGVEYLKGIAAHGGQKTALRGKDYYSEIGRKGMAKRWGEKSKLPKQEKAEEPI